MMTAFVRGSIFACLALLAGCGGAGSGGSAALPPAGGGAVPGTGTLSIRFEGAGAPAAGAKRPAYLSPGTGSVELVVTPTGGGAPQTIAAAMTTDGSTCTSTLSTTSCVVSLPLHAGSYTGVFTTYSGPLAGGAATGSALSTVAGVAINVVAGQTNSVDVSLVGLPASYAIQPMPGETQVVGSQRSGYGLVGTNVATRFSVLALDASGNFIIGNGSPSYAVAVTGTNASDYTVVQPVAASPNVFSISAASFEPAPNTLSVTATIPASAGVSCGGSIACSLSVPFGSGLEIMSDGIRSGSVLMAPPVAANPKAVTSANGIISTDDNSNVLHLSLPPYQSSATILVPVAGGDTVSTVALDASDDLFVFTHDDAVYSAPPPYVTFSLVYQGSLGADPSGFPALQALDDGMLAIVEVGPPVAPNCCNMDYVGVISASGPSTQTPTPIFQKSGDLIGTAIGQNGVLYVAADEGHSVFSFAPPAYTSPTFVLNDGGASFLKMSRLTGGLIVTNGNPLFSLPPYTSTSAPPGGAFQYAFDPLGDLWAVNGAGALLAYNPTGSTLLSSTPNVNTLPTLFVP